MKLKRQNEKHGMSNTPTYYVWINMRRRCENPNNPAYKYYGGRGISVCIRWNSFGNFYEDMGKKPEGLTLERINNNGNYKPGNCEWVTWKKQLNNRRPHSSGRVKQRWFCAWHKNSTTQYLSNNQCEFARKWGLRQGAISRCLRGIRHHYRGWKFKRV